MPITTVPSLVVDENIRSRFTGSISNANSFTDIAYSQVQIASDSGFTTILAEGTTDSETWPLFGYSRGVGTREDTVYVRAKVVNTSAEESDWSSALTVSPKTITAPTVELNSASPVRGIVVMTAFDRYDEPTILRGQVSTSNTFTSPTEITNTTDLTRIVHTLTTGQRSGNLYYRLRLEDADGVSAWSSTLTQSPPTDPAAPTVASVAYAQRIGVKLTSSPLDGGELVIQLARDNTTWTTGLQERTITMGFAEVIFNIDEPDRGVPHYARAKWKRLVDFNDDDSAYYLESVWSDTVDVDAAGDIANIDVRTNAVDSRAIEPERVTAANITPTVTLATGGGLRAIQSGESGQRVIFDADGFRMLNGDGIALFSLPEIGTPTLKAGEVDVSSLRSATQTRLGGTVEVSSDATMTLSGSSVLAPLTAPTVQEVYAGTYTWSDDCDHWSVHYDGTYYWAIAYGSVSDRVRRYTLTGSVMTWDGLTEWVIPGVILHSVTKIGTVLYGVIGGLKDTVKIVSVTAPNGAATSSSTASANQTANCWEPALATDGTRLFLIDTNTKNSASSSLRIRQFNPSGTTVGSAVGTTRTMALPSGVTTNANTMSEVALTAGMLGTSSPADLWVSISDGVVEKVYKWAVTYTSTGISSNPTLATTVDSGWVLAGASAISQGTIGGLDTGTNTGGGAPYGVTKAGSDYIALYGSRDAVKLGWLDAFTYAIEYQWADSSSGYTAVSPSRDYGKVYGTNLFVTLNTVPSSVTRALIYMNKAGGGYKLQATLTSLTAGSTPTTTLTAYTAGAAVAGTSSFGTASPANLKSSETGWELLGSGLIRLTEVSEPAAPASDKAVLFLKDNGSGKTQLCVRFSSGATQVIATQP